MNGTHPHDDEEVVTPPHDDDTPLTSDNVSDRTPGSVVGERVDRGRLGPKHVADVICNATAKGHGGRCNNPAVRGSTKCRMHGGSSLKGIASPQYRHGRYSKHLPTHLKDAYEDARTDDELLSGREELALLTSRVADLTGRLNFGDSGNLWETLREQYDELTAAMNRGEVERMTTCLVGMGETIRHGNDNEGLWAEIKDTCETVNRVRTAENKRQVDLKQLIAAPQAIALVMALVQIVQRNVSDVRILNSIQREVSLLLEYEGDEQEGTPEAQPGVTTDDVQRDGQ